MHGEESSQPAGAEQRGILALLRALADSGVDLAHNAVRMAASEGRVVLHRVVVRLALLLAALLVAAAGLILLLAGASLGLVRFTGLEQWVAFSVVGIVAVAAGSMFAFRAIRRLSEPDLAFPATLAEFRADVDALRLVRGEDGNGTS
jgi:drug/metabolite transporter (DMT)-like permease